MTDHIKQISLHSKLPNTEQSIFSVMSQMANQHNAINLSQGFPDFPVSQELIDLVYKYMNQNCNQYAPASGIPKLKNILSDKIEKLYDRKFNPETEVTITAGATQAIFTAIMALIKEGDEVIVFEPVYDSYVPAIKLAGGMPRPISLTAPNYEIPWDEVKNKLSFKTRMIILNTPHNPCGSIISDDDIEQLKIITEGNDILILSDEVYEHTTYDNKKHISLLGTSLYNRTLAIFSFGKVLHATGWKMGYCVAPEFLMKEFFKVHQFNVFSVNTPIQYAIAEYFENEENYLSVAKMYEKKRDLFLNIMKDSKFNFIPSSGTYFQLMSFSEISNKSDVEFAEELVKEHGIAAIPVSSFYTNKKDEKVLRFCFAKKEETLVKAAELLCKI